MKYFIDFEFIEGFHKPLFGKRRHFIDLISVGVFCEDGREYYAISKEFNPKDADGWVRENVISKLEHKDHQNRVQFPSGAILTSNTWKLNKEIKNNLLDFFGCWQDQHFWRAPDGIEIYGYYADYDWVLLCSLFGRMIDLPKGIPMYCIDLKQQLDEKLTGSMIREGQTLDAKELVELRAMKSPRERLSWLKKYSSEYPAQSKDQEHNALEDARWNYELYKFLQTI